MSVNVGAQAQSRTLNAGFTVPIYGQDATAATVQEIGSGALFDISAGRRVWSNVAVTLGFSTFTDTQDIVGTASIPHPLFFNRPNAVAIAASDAKRTERNVYILASWLAPVTEEIEVMLSLGPSFTNVRQDLITGVTVPPGTQDASPVTDSRSGWATGVNVGLDGTYLFTRSYGVGLFLRYNSASLDVPESETELKTGGFQIGAGVRLRF